MFDNKSRAEENSRIFDFFMRNQNEEDKYAFSIDEIIEHTGIKNLTHEKLVKIGEIIFLKYEKNGISKWYRYENIEKQLRCILDKLIKDELVEERFKNGNISSSEI